MTDLKAPPPGQPGGGIPFLLLSGANSGVVSLCHQRPATAAEGGELVHRVVGRGHGLGSGAGRGGIFFNLTLKS